MDKEDNDYVSMYSYSDTDDECQDTDHEENSHNVPVTSCGEDDTMSSSLSSFSSGQVTSSTESNQQINAAGDALL